jgi:GT2 family glycosyltransferase
MKTGMRWRDELKARWGEVRLSLLWLLAALGKVPGVRRLYRALLRRLVLSTGLFDPAYYLDSNEDLTGQNIRALSHYVIHGDREGRPPMAFFDPLHYTALVDGRLKRINSLLHFAWVGVHRRVSPSAWFDVDFYLSQNKDVARAGMNPLLHYWKFGGVEGRSPSPLFDGAHYLRTYPDVEKARVNPLLHYLRIGRIERRTIRPEQGDATPSEPTAHLLPEAAAWEQLAGRGESLKAQVDVIVPVYKGYVETMLCLYSVLVAGSATDFELVVVDDASPEPALSEKLREMAACGLFTLLVNTENIGFVATVNRGMARHPGRDVILLNSDTEVYDGWVDRLRAAALRNERTGTVTPLSNNATICSYPRFLHDNPFPLEITYAELDRMAAVVNAGIEVESPTAVGFCMYIRRECLVQTGLFDEATFGKGYGEENDFCRRAARRGWGHVIAADVFVRHWGGTSFGGEKPSRMAAAERKLERLHPGYHSEIARFVKQDPLADVRACLDWARLRNLCRDRNVVVISHGRGGGTERRVREEVQRLTRDECGVFLLRPDASQPGMALLRHATARSLPNVYALDFADTSVMCDRLKELRVTEIHVHSLVDFPASAPRLVRRVVDFLGVELHVCLHDYALICPRINLAGEDGYYCGEPEAAACDKCLPAGRKAGDATTIGEWRAMHGEMLARAARVAVPDQDMSARLARYFPRVRFAVAPHEPDFKPVVESTAPAILPGERMRVVVVGAISRLKGYEPLLQCARHARAWDMALEFIVMGYSVNDRELEGAGVTVTGKYRDEEAIARLVSLRPHLVWLPSLWPETYCYTLSIALQAGVPVVAFDIGAMSTRLSRVGPPHRLLPLSMSRAPEQVNRCFASYRNERRV